ncbi:c-type cytochrome [Algirhabdus cladophorae]|uniref:c-type cytochrome n=1 Tax=Algirhabdus cladophorae TaxID=3377108 RepID=UPI003B8492DD
MKFNLIALAAATLMAAPALADGHAVDLTATGDAEAGEKAFKQCVACHVVADADGNVLAGKKAKTGPNLYGVVGRAAGAVEDFKYSKSMIAAGEEAGLIWAEESFVAYVQDPTGFLRIALDDKKARGKMAFKVRKEEDALNLYAYLKSIGPAMEEAAEETTTTN